MKLVIINELDKKDGYCKMARLYFHDERKNEAHLLADEIEIHELESALATEYAKVMRQSMLDKAMDK